MFDRVLEDELIDKVSEAKDLSYKIFQKIFDSSLSQNELLAEMSTLISVVSYAEHILTESNTCDYCEKKIAVMKKNAKLWS